METYGYIYKTTTPEHDTYIGQHKGDFDPTYFGSGTRIQNYIKKHGTDNLSVEVLEMVGSRKEIDERELYYIKTLNPTMNLLREENHGWYYVNKLIKSGKINPPSRYKGKTAWNKGKSWDEEIKK